MNRIAALLFLLALPHGVIWWLEVSFGLLLTVVGVTFVVRGYLDILNPLADRRVIGGYVCSLVGVFTVSMLLTFWRPV